jgi:hypothetical protein
MGYHWRGSFNKVGLITEKTEQARIDKYLEDGKAPVFTIVDQTRPWRTQPVMTLQHQKRSGTDNKYWYAFRTIHGKTYTAYVGRDLELARLMKAWQTIEDKAWENPR